VAGIAGTVVLSVFGSAVAFAAGGFAAFHVFGVAHGSYFQLTLVRGTDLALGLLKALAFGAAIPLVASHEGLCARGGAAGVGRATTRAVIGSSLAVLVLDLVIGAVAQLVEGPLP
jgi:phospholipid/cholesterol/gamma-HCH transport system permease protein